MGGGQSFRRNKKELGIEVTKTFYMCQEKKVEDKSPALIIVQTRRLHKNRKRKTKFTDQKQRRQHKDQLNKNSYLTEMGRKIIVRIFQVVN